MMKMKIQFSSDRQVYVWWNSNLHAGIYATGGMIRYVGGKNFPTHFWIRYSKGNEYAY